MYTKDLAEVLKERAGQKWRPSNGTEGEIFRESWCYQCKKDVKRDCSILVATLMLDVDDERYPREWQYGKDGQPLCTAFEPLKVVA